MAVWCNGWNTAERHVADADLGRLMVQARPNRARLSGEIEHLAVTADCPAGWSEMTLRVVSSDDIDGMANMLRDLAGSSVALHVRSDDIARAAVAAGNVVTVEARRVSPGRIVGDGATLGQRPG